MCLINRALEENTKMKDEMREFQDSIIQISDTQAHINRQIDTLKGLLRRIIHDLSVTQELSSETIAMAPHQTRFDIQDKAMQPKKQGVRDSIMHTRVTPLRWAK